MRGRPISKLIYWRSFWEVYLKDRVNITRPLGSMILEPEKHGQFTVNIITLFYLHIFPAILTNIFDIVLDAIAKLPPGLTQGNINWLGSIETCNEVDYDHPYFPGAPIKGKYCRADIGFPIEQVAVSIRY